MKRTLLLLTSASLVLAFSVALPLLGVATDLSASQLNLASPQLGPVGAKLRFHDI